MFLVRQNILLSKSVLLQALYKQLKEIRIHTSSFDIFVASDMEQSTESLQEVNAIAFMYQSQ
jgi:hypothetical protein